MTEKRDMFGLKVTVGTADELRSLVGDSPSLHVIVRCEDAVGDKPYPALAQRRRRMPCEECPAICWYDPKSIVDPAAKFVCIQCAERITGQKMADFKGNLSDVRIVSELLREWRP